MYDTTLEGEMQIKEVDKLKSGEYNEGITIL